MLFHKFNRLFPGHVFDIKSQHGHMSYTFRDLSIGCYSGRIFLTQEQKTLHNLIMGSDNMDFAFYDYAPEVGGKLVGYYQILSYDTKRATTVGSYALHLMTIDGAVEVYTFITVIYVADWHTVWFHIGIYQRQGAVCSLTQDFPYRLLAEQLFEAAHFSLHYPNTLSPTIERISVVRNRILQNVAGS